VHPEFVCKRSENATVVGGPAAPPLAAWGADYLVAPWRADAGWQ
jgi:hypothetical protein